ncbi:TAXI family TRAP transporter solute-binding subunit [Candidatus Methylospira mobilis]|uniref:TAXI family TRAP transporter solute-binding subunit n=1 Tax=Candidatus Methylospira mobilis TaxID=1808979 RepID=UPI0028ECAFE7|nr:TAXI family TRAP transporter solute-binding subunit [Candidatus Methylospira mobilis]WNV03098.1 TAXI family TRAP transporter solute-binding subunit [Candidatus Methylospira mobilis]
MKKITTELKEHFIAIYETVRDEIASWLQIARDAWPLLLLLGMGLGGALWFAKPAPPDHVYLAASDPGGEFYAMGKQYVEFFREQGVTLELVPSHGGKQNFDFLKNKQDPVQAAFVQSGIVPVDETAGLLSLGSINYQPLWFFYRGTDDQEAEEKIGKFLSRKISIGPEGSSTRIQALRILALNGFQPTPNMLALSHDEAIAALRRGDIDGMFIVHGINSRRIQDLLHDTKLRLASFIRAQAYARQMDYISVLEVPMGGFDLARNFPPRDTQLLTTTASLLVDSELHPAIQMLFLQAATAINGRGDYFARIKEFPAYRDATVPESPVAMRYHKSGPPFLMHYLPFWIAEFIDRLAVLILPLVAFAYPILSKIPGYRLNRLRARLAKSYGELKFLEADIVNHYKSEAHEEYRQRLGDLELNVVATRIPLSLTEYYFGLRTHIDYVRDKLMQSRKAVSEAAKS